MPWHPRFRPAHSLISRTPFPSPSPPRKRTANSQQRLPARDGCFRKAKMVVRTLRVVIWFGHLPFNSYVEFDYNFSVFSKNSNSMMSKSWEEYKDCRMFLDDRKNPFLNCNMWITENFPIMWPFCEVGSCMVSPCSKIIRLTVFPTGIYNHSFLIIVKEEA